MMSILLLAAMLFASPRAPERSEPVLVRVVLDGDTIDVAGIGRVRLLGIDAPEMGSRFETPAPFAVEAKNRLADLVASRWVRLEYDVTSRDGYNRRLAYVLLDRFTCVNEMLVREGLARVSARIPLSRLAELKRAEAQARDARRGIWRNAPSRPAERYVLPRQKVPSKPGSGRPRNGRKPPRGAARRAAGAWPGVRPGAARDDALVELTWADSSLR